MPGASVSFGHVAAFPIGTDPDTFAALPDSEEAVQTAELVSRALAGRDLIIGVDRLDYSKGLPERIAAYERLLERFPDFRRRVHMLQIAAPTRDGIAEYQDINDALDNAAGRVLGRFAEPDWVPLNYVKRAYPQAALAGLYRIARVGLVTPLRDGMNLVAHEFVACQQNEDPGVLVLSQFAGAAEMFPAALQVNPYDADETAGALNQALTMPLADRQARWRELRQALDIHSIDNWADNFLAALGRPQEPGRDAPVERGYGPEKAPRQAASTGI
jgi:trehalose 6-phosphate synthase